MSHAKTLVHVTQNAADLAGESAATLRGLVTSNSYVRNIERTIFIGPWLDDDPDVPSSLGPGSQLLYTREGSADNHPFAGKLVEIETNFGVRILYGRQAIQQPGINNICHAEVILIDVTRANPYPVNILKAWMFDEFDLASDRYEHNNQYELYVRLAPAALATLRALGASDPCRPAVMVSHDYVGVPTAMAAILDPLCAFKTVYYANDVPTARRIVNTYPGHDTLFYNAIKWARQNDYYMSELFGPQDLFFKHALTTTARHCDNVIAVSDHAKDELRFLGPHFNATNIDLAYNGLSANEITLTQKRLSHSRLQQYAGSLLGYSPDFVFTHIAEVSTSAALWRDLRVLYHLEPLLRRDGQTAVYFLYSTNTSADTNDKLLNESTYESAHDLLSDNSYNNPRSHPHNRRVAHRGQHWAISQAEADFYSYIQEFNALNRNIKAVLVNQLGWEAHKHDLCMPQEMELADLRIGSDLEFNQSIYEPFGSASLESLAFGGLSVISNVSGCNGPLNSLCCGLTDSVITADYTQIDPHRFNRDGIFAIDQSTRDRIEDRVGAQLARAIHHQLPRDDNKREQLLMQGLQLAGQMNWDNICETFFLPAVNRAYHKHRPRQTA